MVIENPEHNLDQTKYVLSEIDTDNLNFLISIRKEIDGEADQGKLEREANKYATVDGHKAFIIQSGANPVSFVEIDLEEKLPDNCPPIENIDDLAHLSRIGTVVIHRRKGIGSKLISSAETWAKENGKKGIWLDYLPKDELIDFYHNNGYKEAVSFLDERKGKTRTVAVKLF